MELCIKIDSGEKVRNKACPMSGMTSGVETRHRGDKREAKHHGTGKERTVSLKAERDRRVKENRMRRVPPGNGEAGRRRELGLSD